MASVLSPQLPQRVFTVWVEKISHKVKYSNLLIPITLNIVLIKDFERFLGESQKVILFLSDRFFGVSVLCDQK